MAGTSEMSGYDIYRYVRVLNLVTTLLNLNPHVMVRVVYLAEFRELSLAQVS
jgi:hypothetical protein